MLDAMKHLGESVRGVVVIDKATSPAELASMYASGVRGVRVNLETWSHNDTVVAREKLAYAVESAGRLGWHVQIYASRGLVEIGRAACRERVCQYVEITVVPGQLKKK